MESTYLKPFQLAERWGVTVTTLSQWRWNGKGPCYLKMGRHVVYPIQDIEDFEQARRRRSTSEQPDNPGTAHERNNGANNRRQP